jgi:hypothetical protein
MNKGETVFKSYVIYLLFEFLLVKINTLGNIYYNNMLYILGL